MLSKFLTVALAASLVSAQTFTECDPTKKGECPHPRGTETCFVCFAFHG